MGVCSGQAGSTQLACARLVGVQSRLHLDEHILLTSCPYRMKLAVFFLALVLVEGRMVTRDDREVVRQAGDEEELNKNRGVRQTAEAEQEENQAGPFDLFGQVLNSFGGLLGQLATVGGEFISEQQRLNQPVHEELGKIGGTISRSGFVQGATNGVAEVPNLIGTILSRMQVNRTEQPDA